MMGLNPAGCQGKSEKNTLGRIKSSRIIEVRRDQFGAEEGGVVCIENLYMVQSGLPG